MTRDKRQRILDKIRKLQAKTTTMGCTEAEALAAAHAIGKLLDAYGLTMTDVELQSTTWYRGRCGLAFCQQSAPHTVLSRGAFYLL